jgi:hypothetical protein
MELFRIVWGVSRTEDRIEEWGDVCSSIIDSGE